MSIQKSCKFVIAISCITLLFSGCANESSRTIDVPKVAVSNTPYQGKKIAVSIGRFNNQSSYNNGIFSDGNDRLGSQAQTILITNLQQSGRFSVLDRTNLKAMKQESVINKEKQQLKGAHYIITGDVVEFGRKTTGDYQLFGILGKGKTQTAYAKVNLNVVAVKNSEVIYSAQGAGEYALSNREVVGFGGTAGYDSTLNGKVLSLAIREAVNNLAHGLDNGSWHNQ